LGGFGVEAGLADEGGEDFVLDYALDEPLEAPDIPLGDLEGGPWLRPR
jgi:hypothetical protein